ncbi:MAG: RHS repeat-associated core domain-containing protein [Pseudomonadota bacterium]
MKEDHSFVMPFKRSFISKVFVLILISFFLTSIAHTARAEGSPEALKRSAIQRLTNLQVGKKKVDKSVEKAISHIEKSLADRLWEDAAHLAPAPQGKQVFHEEHKAVQQLKKIAQSKKISKDIKNAVLDALQALVAADSAIADAALSEAGAYAGTSKKVDHFIKKSKKNLQKAERLRERGQYARAIKCFEKAWHHARMARKHAGEAQPPVEPPTVTITAAPTSITQGESSTLSWSSTNAESVTVDNGIGEVAPSGSIAVSPSQTTMYTITATNSAGSATAEVTISVIVPPTVTITVSPSLIALGESTTLAWSSTNAESVIIDNGIGEVGASGSLAVSPSATTTYVITATNGAGSVTDTATISVIPPPTVDIAADPVSIILGAGATLSWTSTDADTVSIDNGIGQVAPSGLLAVSPTATTTYSITASNASGTATDTVTISVLVPPTTSISADRTSIVLGESVTLSWTATNADTVAIDNGIGQVDPSGSITVFPGETTTYTVTANNAAGSATDSVTVSVIVPPTVDISADPDSITLGELSTLTWSSTSADTVTIDNGIGDVAPNDSLIVSPTQTTTYTITATNSAGSAQSSATITLVAAVAPLPEGSFGKQYEDLVPPDATIGAYDARRFVVITGFVYERGMVPLSGVAISLHNHPEYGISLSDENGRFSIPADGGGLYTVVYEKEGYITAHRQVQTPWNDIVIVDDDPVLIQQDAKATQVVFDGNPGTVTVHESTPVTDEFGTRACTMVFAGDNRAYAVDENGNEVELATITTRATEFDTPESMPAILPPTSAYTYCAELSVDGAKSVRFAKPVITYIDNFLGFDVGEVVPVGYYDRDRGVWVPEENGVVVQLLDTDTDGIADALDADGDDAPDDLNQNGSYSDEVRGLSDAERYVPGSTFWRVAVSHFSARDWNWPWGFPFGWLFPNARGEIDVDQAKCQDCPIPTNSFTEARSRIFHEDIPIAGTDITLHYASKRVEGYKTVITIPVSGEEIPATVKRVMVNVKIAGRKWEQTFEPLPNLTMEIVWDGLNYLGDRIKDRTTAHIEIGFLYDAVYYGAASDTLRSFAMAGSETTQIRARQEVIAWKRSKALIDVTQGRSTIAEGWTLSPHHWVSPMDLSTLHKGNGTTIKNNVSIINTVAGNGTAGYSGDDGPATEVMLRGPWHIAVDAVGNVYIADFSNSRIRKLDTNGIITTVAGGGNPPDGLGDGGPATEARLFMPIGITVGTTGNLYIADTYNFRIRKLDTNGIITTVAGNGTRGYSGDGGPATEAQFRYPTGVAVDASGNLYVADTENHRIRKIDINGIITTVAGNGTLGYDGDGGPAIEAAVRSPYGIAVDSEGNLYITAYNYCWIRKVDTTGIITTVAGNGTMGYSGDGGPATEAQLSSTLDVAVDAAGNLYIADWNNNRIRKVDTSGMITTFAGTGDAGYSGDGGAAVEAQMGSPYGVAVDSEGTLYIADSANQRIRKVAPQSTFVGAMNLGEVPFADENGLGHTLSSAGRHEKTIDLNTGETLLTFDYNENEQLIAITDRFGNQTIIQRDAAGTPLSITSPDGIVTSLTIDANNHLTQVTYPDGSSYGFAYTADGLMADEYDPNGNRFEHWFDANGRLADIVDPEGGHWQYGRETDAAGNILASLVTGEGNLTTYLDNTDSTGAYTSYITDPTGAVTNYYRSSDGLSVVKELPCGMNLNFQYGLDPEFKFKYVTEMNETTQSGLVRTTTRDKTYVDTDGDELTDLITETVTVNGKTATVTQDVNQGQITSTSPEGRQVATLYDPATLLAGSIEVPGLYATYLGYDERGRLVASTTNERMTNFTYDAYGNLATVTDATGLTTAYAYDLMGRVRTIFRPDGGQVNFAYDAGGNMTVLTTPAGVNHRFDHNGVNLQSAYSTPQSGGYLYHYDRDRRLNSIVFPSGKEITNVYTGALLASIETQEGSTSFEYECASKVSAISRGTERVDYAYDASLVTEEALSGTINQVLGYTYDNDFNVASFTYAGDTSAYAYDNDGLLTGAGDFSITRDAANGLPLAVSDGVFGLNRGFNGYGEPANLAYAVGSASYNLAFARDRAGRIITRIETIDGASINWEYAYDDLGRLVAVTQNGIVVEEYQYDANGNRTYERNDLRGIAGRTSTYDIEDHLLTVGADTYLYDADGFLVARYTAEGTTTYTYASTGELKQVVLADGKTIEYLHDPLGRRIAKKVNGVVTEKYLWQGLTRLLAVYDGSDSLIARFAYADARVPVAMEQGGSTYYLIPDQVGSIRLVVDAPGNIVKKIDYDSFGNILNNSNPSFVVPFGFAGGLHDRDTGLVRFGFRDYDPETGRWTAKDPILFAGGDVNLYGYCLNDPINLVDSDGLKWYDKLAEFLTGAAVKDKVAEYVDSPEGQRIITAGISGAAGGLVLGGVAGTPLAGVGAVPSAVCGAIVGSAVNMLKQVAKEALGVPELIERTTNKVRGIIPPMNKTAQRIRIESNEEENPCP